MSIAVALLLACTPPPPGVGDVLPAAGATGVPANAAIVFETSVHGADVTTMVVLTSGMGGYSGPAVIGDGGVWVFDPGVPLAAGNWSATVTVFQGGLPGTKTVGFVAVSTTDAAAPVFAGDDVAFDVDAYVDVGPVGTCPDPPGVYAVETDWPDATDATPLLYAVNGLLLSASEATLAAAPSVDFVLEVFAYDEAGNAGALPPATHAMPDPPDGDDGGGCSCRVAPGPAVRIASPFLLALLALATILRRRR